MKGKALLETAIEALIFQGGDENAIILKLGLDYYVQFASRRGAHKIYCEAVGNHNIEEEEAYLDENQIKKLLALGWKIPETPGNFYQVHAVDSEALRAKLIQMLIDTITQVYAIHEIREADFIVELY